jgi:hypothetical protein
MRNRVLAFSFLAFLAIQNSSQPAFASSATPPHASGSAGNFLSKESKNPIPRPLWELGLSPSEPAVAVAQNLPPSDLPLQSEGAVSLETSEDSVGAESVNVATILEKTPTHDGTKPLHAGLNFDSDLRFSSIGFAQAVDVDAQPLESDPLFTPQLLSQTAPLSDTSPVEEPDPAELEEVQTDLEAIEELGSIEDPADFSSPSLTIANPSGYGVDRNTFFISGTFQERTRFSDTADGGLGLGIGLFDSRRLVGVEVSYTLASFGRNRSFGTGGFNLKVHRRFSESFSAAIGWNGFLTLGDDTSDFEDSVYGSVTKIFRIRDNVNQPFSRIAVTAGAGTGQFRLEDDVDDDNSTVNPFGSVAVRIVEPVSLITEWTGQDLALGVSIAPFNNFNFVITPALRDITGAGDGTRFVLGFGTSFQF